MPKPKGKTPSLLAMNTGTPSPHVCGKATECDRCTEKIKKGDDCFQIPKLKAGFTSRPLFCPHCTKSIIEQTKLELLAVEKKSGSLTK